MFHAQLLVYTRAATDSNDLNQPTLATRSLRCPCSKRNQAQFTPRQLRQQRRQGPREQPSRPRGRRHSVQHRPSWQWLTRLQKKLVVCYHSGSCVDLALVTILMQHRRAHLRSSSGNSRNRRRRSVCRSRASAGAGSARRGAVNTDGGRSDKNSSELHFDNKRRLNG